jgi:hypothetical protein
VSYSFVLKLSKKRIIDWDLVWAIPLKLSAISIEEFWDSPEARLDNNQVQLFRDELCRIEREKSGSMEWSQMFLQSRENTFLNDILNWGDSLPDLQRKYPELLAEALHRTSGTLALAASEWKSFTDEYFIDRNHTVPNWPRYVEIQEALGIYGPSQFDCAFRRIKRSTQKHLNMFFDGLCSAILKMWGKLRPA